MNEQQAIPLLKMAVRASKDPTLLASQLDQIAKQENRTWQEIASQLGIDEMQLAKLALCRRPEVKRYDAEVKQIATYVGMERVVLDRFLSRHSRTQSERARVQPAKRLPRWNISLPRPVVWAAGFALLFVIVLSASMFASPAKAEATLIVDQGQATATISGVLSLTAPKDVVVSAGQMYAVRAGDRIALKEGARARLQLYDGSSVELLESAQVDVAELATSRNSYRVHLEQRGGTTVNRVIRLLGLNDRFEISTPSSTVSVRGTMFRVSVVSDASTFVAVEKGVVHFEMGDAAADIRAGEELLGVLGQPLQVRASEGKTPYSTFTATPETGMPTGLPTVATTVPPTSIPAAPSTVPPLATPQPTAIGGDGQPMGTSAPPGVVQPSAVSTKQVPGKPPSQVPGEGNPPEGGGEPPGQAKDKDNDPPGQDKEKNDPPGKNK